MNTIQKLENNYKQCFKDAARAKEIRQKFFDLFPKEVLEMEAGSISVWDFSSSPEIDFVPPIGNNAERHQWTLQTIKFLESTGFVFPEKPIGHSESVQWIGKKELENGKTITIEINNCPVPPGCIIRKEITIVPEHEEEVSKVVCLEDERNEINTLVEA